MYLQQERGASASLFFFDYSETSKMNLLKIFPLVRYSARTEGDIEVGLTFTEALIDLPRGCSSEIIPGDVVELETVKTAYGNIQLNSVKVARVQGRGHYSIPADLIHSFADDNSKSANKFDYLFEVLVTDDAGNVWKAYPVAQVCAMLQDLGATSLHSAFVEYKALLGRVAGHKKHLQSQFINQLIADNRLNVNVADIFYGPNELKCSEGCTCGQL